MSAAQPCDDSLAGETTREDKALQSGRFRTVVADPPWPYENESWGVGAVGDEYATMTYEDICALPVTEWVERDAHLYLWVTNAKLLDYDYAQLINAWGFSYKTCLTWHKTACLGIGHYFRGETEHILFCTRGRAPIAPEHRERNLFQSPRGRHSAKPDALYDLVERVSPGPYLDMFSRRARLGWHTWGAESLHGNGGSRMTDLVRRRPYGPHGMDRGGSVTQEARSAATPRYYQAIIKVNPTDTPERQASDIADGIGYACALLIDEYGWTAERIAGVLERVTDDVADQEAQRG